MLWEPGARLAGVALGLRGEVPGVTIALTDPEGAALYNWFDHGELKGEGSSVSEGIGQSRITANLEGLSVDTQFRVSDAEGLEWVHRLNAEEGLCLGLSSGINVAGAVRLARATGSGTQHRHHPVRQRIALPIDDLEPGVVCRPGLAGAPGTDVKQP